MLSMKLLCDEAAAADFFCLGVFPELSKGRKTGELVISWRLFVFIYQPSICPQHGKTETWLGYSHASHRSVHSVYSWYVRL